jgi:tetratricopeptide (TPR) repeat protein
MKKRKTRLAIACLFPIISVLIAFGQAGRGRARLTGIVTDDAGNPIASARIILRLVLVESGIMGSKVIVTEPASFEAITDNKGRWSYIGLGTGIWEVTAWAKGYYPASRKCSVFQLQENQTVPLRLEKIPEPVGEDLIEVSLLEKANDLFYLQRFDEAIVLYQIYLHAHPEIHTVALSIGYCLEEKGDFDAAIAQFQAVIEKTSKNPLDSYFVAQGYGCIAECYWKKKDVSMAEASFRRALEKGAENDQWAYNLAEICFFRGATDEAIGYYKEASRLAPGWSDPEYKLGLAFLKKGDGLGAKDHFEKFLRLEPKTARSALVKRELADLIKKLSVIRNCTV